MSDNLTQKKHKETAFMHGKLPRLRLPLSYNKKNDMKTIFFMQFQAKLKELYPNT
jgi:hypothetical protein